MVSFRVLGSMAVCGSDGELVDVSVPKVRTLLAALLLRGGEWVSTARLIEALWGALPPASAHGNLKTYVWQLRGLLTSVLGERRVAGRAGGYRLTLAADELDVEVFSRRAEHGRRLVGTGDAAEAVAVLTDALRLWRGEPFADVPPVLVEPQVAALSERHWAVREDLARAMIALGRGAMAVPELRAMVGAQPLREPLWTLLIRALLQAGRRADALVAYQQVYHLLVRELGVGPAEELRAAHRLALAR